MNSTSWFSHDSNARNSKKMIRLRKKYGAKGYGVYWMLVERLREEEDYTSDRDYSMISYDLHESEELIRAVVEDFGLFDLSPDGKTFKSHGLDERMKIKEVRSTNGKKGAAARWGDKNPSGMAQNGKTMANQNFANANKEKESKEKKNKKEILSFFQKENEEEKIFIVSQFFFRGYANPNAEYDLFIAFNNRPGSKGWDEYTRVEKFSAFNLWKQKPEQACRLPRDFLDMWKNVYDVFREIGTPPEILLEALSDNIAVSIDKKSKTLSLTLPDSVRKYIENGQLPDGEHVLEKVRPFIWPYILEKGCEKLFYNMP